MKYVWNNLKICKLDNFLHDHKQDPKKWNEIFDNLMISNGFKSEWEWQIWNEIFDNLMISNGFKVNDNDKYSYYKSKNNICTIISLRVDNLLIFVWFEVRNWVQDYESF